VTTLAAPAEELVSLAIGERLVVAAGVNSTGRVARNSAPGVSTVSGNAPAHYTATNGPAEYRIRADKGTLTFEVQDVLTGDIKRATRNLQSAAVIAKALNEGHRMALSDKARLLTERAKTVPAAIEKRMDASLARLAGAEARSTAPLDQLDAHVADIEAGIAATEDAVAQLSNGAPPLGG
jgi:hypothetical protein